MIKYYKHLLLINNYYAMKTEILINFNLLFLFFANGKIYFDAANRTK